jgi:hypothetical protein
VEKNNKAISPDDVMTYNSHSISREEVSKIISKYDQGDKTEGLGLVFVVESFDKNIPYGAYWVTFFDIKTKKVLFTERCAGTPIGIGLRNYWAGSLKNVLTDIREQKFKMWKKQVRDASAS